MLHFETAGCLLLIACAAARLAWCLHAGYTRKAKVKRDEETRRDQDRLEHTKRAIEKQVQIEQADGKRRTRVENMLAINIAW